MIRKVAILTSSRADYSIYYPLLKELKRSDEVQLEIVAFGTHLSERHGYTIQRILEDGFEVTHRISDTIAIVPSEVAQGEQPFDIALAMGKTTEKFAEFWRDHRFDLVFCLGDRYEMFAAVCAGVPFQVNFAHLYGGEETLGAIDNSFRHGLTHMCQWHFTACEAYAQRVVELTHQPQKVFNYGHLSIDNLSQIPLLNVDEFYQKTGLDKSKPFLLSTFHPETVNFEKNKDYASALARAFAQLSQYEVLITMPNADTGGLMIRNVFEDLAKKAPHVKLTENLGTVGYLSAMKHCAMMVGNTSSGFVEASFFPKRVINLGQRQMGRLLTENIWIIEINTEAILEAVANASANSLNSIATNVYGSGNTASKIMALLLSGRLYVS